MSIIINYGTNSSTTQDWLKAIEGMHLTAYDPLPRVHEEVEVIEPGQATNLSVAERARMNRTMPGIYTPPERL
jgi:hypothetical protein